MYFQFLLRFNSFLAKSPDTHGDSVNGFKYLREAYVKTDPDYNGAITVRYSSNTISNP
jgi:glutathionyl-hydroquinone reductase